MSRPVEPPGAAPAGESAVASLSPLRRALLSMEKMEAKLSSLERARTEPIAIVGMGCRLPGGASSPEAFWRLLEDGVDAITEVPVARWSVRRAPDTASAERRGIRWGGFLKEEVDRFDHHFFDISPREAASMDPQQRLVLEVAWEALECAGQTPDRLMGTRAGVFLGVVFNDYRKRNDTIPREALDIYNFTGNLNCFPAGRLSFVLGLEGPSMSIDTACSSSLVAVHLACQSLRSGESSLGLAGGVNLMLDPATTDLLATTQALSPEGRCKTFDAQANGFVRGEGCGIVVLKRLSDAQADGDTIVALIRGSAVNQDGRSTGLTAPNVLSQQAMLRQALENARVSPAMIGYVETHGTGTSLGDPIEVEALKEVLGAPREDGSVCALGSAKTNVGHLEAAAGVAGLIKAVLALRHEAIPANLHFRTLNPRISLQGTPFVIPTEEIPWKAGDKPRCAGVSSFGLSGTNAHVILEEAPHPVAPEAASAQAGAVQLLPISARSAGALRELSAAYRGFLETLPEEGLADACYTASVRRRHDEHRLAVVGRSRQEICTSLDAFGRGEPHPGMESGCREIAARPRVVFVFPGQGSQWVGMGRELLREEPSFRSALEACDRAIRGETGWSVLEELAADPDRSQLDRIDVVQPVLFAVEVALAALWRSLGVEPDAVVGHSMGEIAAACVAGALRLEDAARIICRRSRILRRQSGKGAMALVELSLEQAEEALHGYEARLSIAASNGPRSTVLSGDTAALDEVLQTLERNGVFCRRVKVDVASHSPQVDPLKDELLAVLDGVSPRASTVPICSTVTGQVGNGSGFNAAYWVQNVRAPVLFWSAIHRLLDDGHRVFIEMSPHPILLPPLEKTLCDEAPGSTAVASLRRQGDERRSLLDSLATLYARGCAVDWSRLHPQRGRVVPLPAYPWQRERCWLEGQREDRGGSRSATYRGEGHPLLGMAFSSSIHPDMHFWEQLVGVEALPYLAEHRVQGEVVFPGAAFVEMALSAGAELHGSAEGIVLEDVTLDEMLALPPKGERLLQMVLTEAASGRGSFQISSKATGETVWRKHTAGRLHRDAHAAASTPSREAPEALRERAGERISAAEHQQRMEARGLSYGPAFQGLESVWLSSTEALARVRLPDEVASGAGVYQIHPALLDACLQTAAVLLSPTGSAAAEDGPCVPVGIRRLQLHSRPGRGLWVMARCCADDGAADPRERACDVTLMDEEGHALVEIERLQVRILEAGTAAARDELGACVHAIAWRKAAPLAELPAPHGAVTGGAWLVLSDERGTGAALQAFLQARGEACVRVVAGDRYELVAPDQVRIDPSKPEAYRKLLRETFGEDGLCRGVVHLFGLDATPVEAMTASTLEADLARGTLSAVSLAQAIVRQGWRDVPRLWLITRGAQAVGGRDLVSVSQAPLWGLGRTIALEHPELQVTCIDLDRTPGREEAALLLRELDARGREDQIALRNEARYLARLTRSRFDAEDAPGEDERLEPANGRPFRIEVLEPGALERLQLRETSRRPPGPGEVEIEVEAAGLNFIDIMKVLGIYPGLPPGPVALGIECAGRIVALGEVVSGFEIGQEVIATSPWAFSSHVTVSGRCVLPKPPHLDVAQAATLPAAFMTAWYALHHVGRASRGERILIHSAAGGTGLAAVELARTMGLEIFATAGNEEKRAYLRSLGVACVMDSRTLSFADEILQATGGRGVDLVLGSLTGEAREKSLEALAPYGRFLDLAKRDIYAGARLDLSPFRKCLSYSAIDLLGMSRDRPEQYASLLADVVQRFAEGALTPLPVKVFPASDAAEAFHFMAQAGQIGKIAIAMKDRSARIASAAQERAPRVRGDASYLVTGGLGGLGLTVAQGLVERGARHLVLVGRTGPSDEARNAVHALEEAGASVSIVQADISRASDVERLLTDMEARLPPLRGVVHAAGVLEDHTLLELSEEHFHAVFAPKVHGAWNLHTRTAGKPLDFFVLYGSAASVLGTPGQGNYAAANAFMDAMAHLRNAAGLPAMSIQWGAFSEVGLAAAQENRGERLSYRGIQSLTPAEGLSALDRLLQRPRAEVGVMRFDVWQWTEFHPRLAGAPFLSELQVTREARAGAPEATAVHRDLANKAPGERRALLEEHVRERLGRVLRLPTSRIDRLAPFKQLGVDSLMSLELRNHLEASLSLKLSATLLFTYPNATSLAEHLLDRLGLAPKPEETASAPETSERERLEHELDQMSDEELTSMLASKLAAPLGRHERDRG